MCTTCGCGQGEVELTESWDIPHESPTKHAHSPVTTEDRLRPPVHFGKGLAGVHVPGLSQARIVSDHGTFSARIISLRLKNRQLLATIVWVESGLQPGIRENNVIGRNPSSAGRPMHRRGLSGGLAVIEGIRKPQDANPVPTDPSVPAVQNQHWKGCHLWMRTWLTLVNNLIWRIWMCLYRTFDRNLVRPAAFDLGEDAKGW